MRPNHLDPVAAGEPVRRRPFVVGHSAVAIVGRAPYRREHDGLISGPRHLAERPRVDRSRVRRVGGVVPSDVLTAESPDPDEFIRAAMRWHFSEETGSPFWLERARTLDFDPRTDVTSIDDLALFPNAINELRDVRAEDLIPRGYQGKAEITGIFESGGTTGAPKRVVFLEDWFRQNQAWDDAQYDAHGLPRNVNWLSMTPNGPHVVGYFVRRQAEERGGCCFSIDMDPRWVKKLIATGRADQVDEYAGHLIEQSSFVLRTQDIGAMMTTPPMLERMARDDDLVELVNEKVKAIVWGGAHLDADTRHLLRTEVFEGVQLYGVYGSTMILSTAVERLGPTDDDQCVFDTYSPFVTFRVVDQETGGPVPYGERGQVVMSHVSKSALLPNNLERDTAIRVEPPAGQVGDSVADVSPVKTFDDGAVIEGVY
jgi:phenylacetate-coenzyme A ligase PaaK-like adenylate-forming protein